MFYEQADKKTAMTHDTVKLNTSILGTKKYWDDFYNLEHSNFQSNPIDTGECWFEDSNAEDKICEFIFSQLPSVDNIKTCDLGTGNGHLLFQLYDEGLRGELVGVDYSEKSIEFAKDIAKDGNYKVNFEKCDLLKGDDKFVCENKEKFDLVLDKGTLDAIALSDETYEGGKSGVQVYPKNTGKLVKKRGILLVTSCNFTEPELTKIITSYDKFSVWKRIEYPCFEFGGNKGSTICSVAFIKN